MCVEAYNDWMIDEWCAGAGHGRLIPLTLIPLWDPELAAAEVRRCAAKGSFAVAFSENPVRLGLPSIYSGHWDPLLRRLRGDRHGRQHAHRLVVVAPDDVARRARRRLAGAHRPGAALRCRDWLTSGMLDRFPRLKVALSEGQVGGCRSCSNASTASGTRGRVYGERSGPAPRAAQHLHPGQVYGCVFDDLIGLQDP